MAAQLAAEQARAREARDRLAEATAAHAAELDRIREETQARITIAEEDRDSAIERAEHDAAAAKRTAERPRSPRPSGRPTSRSARPRPTPTPSSTMPKRTGTRRASSPSSTGRPPNRRTSARRPLTHAQKTHAQKSRGRGKTPRVNSSSCAPRMSAKWSGSAPMRRASGTSCASCSTTGPGCSQRHGTSSASAPSGPSATLTPRGPSWPRYARTPIRRTPGRRHGGAPAGLPKARNVRANRPIQPGRGLRPSLPLLIRSQCLLSPVGRSRCLVSSLVELTHLPTTWRR